LLNSEAAGGAHADGVADESQNMSADDLKRRSRLLDNEIRVLKDESTRLGLEQQGLTEKIKENKEKIKLSNQLPYLVGNVVEILDVSPDDEEVGSALLTSCLRLHSAMRQSTMLHRLPTAISAMLLGRKRHSGSVPSDMVALVAGGA